MKICIIALWLAWYPQCNQCNLDYEILQHSVFSVQQNLTYEIVQLIVNYINANKSHATKSKI